MKKWIKRSICVFVSVTLTAGAVLAGILPSKTEAAVTYTPSKAEVCLLPEAAMNNAMFITKYVHAGDSNCNNKFKLVSYSKDNMKASLSIGGNLSTSDTFQKKNHSNLWYVNYSYVPSGVVQALSKDKQFEIYYTGYLGSDEHRNLDNHWGSLWGTAKVLVKANVADCNAVNTLISTESKNEKDGQGVYNNHSQRFTDIRGFEELTFHASSTTCVCSDCFVKNNSIYMVDIKDPRILNTYVSKDLNGFDKVDNGKGFKANEEFYITLEFDEYIRFANNKTQSLKLNLDFYDKFGQEADVGATAELQKLSGKKLVFKFKVPETVKGEKTNLRLEKISDTQEWIGNPNSYDLAILGSDGNAKTYKYGIEFKTNTAITDLAGNPVTWTYSKKDFQSTVLLDNENPEISSVTLSGGHIVSDVSMNKDSWPDDIDRSAVFPGAGDNITFTAMFSEQLDINTTNYLLSNQITAKLNLVDSSNKPIELKAVKIWNDTATNVLGKDAPLGQLTIVKFEPLKITSDMKPSDYSSGEQLKIVSIDGMDSVTDMVGNVMSGLNNITVPKQNQYVDTIPPQTTTDLQADDNVYTPTTSTDGKTFTVPISVDDVADSEDEKGEYVSGVKGLYADFVLGLPHETYTKGYQYCYSTTSQVPEDAKWLSAYAEKGAYLGNDVMMPRLKRSIPVFEKKDGNRLYLHIRLNAVEGYNYKPGTSIFEGIIYLYVKDNAGNSSRKDFKLSYNMDKVKPDAQRTKHTVTADSDDDERTLQETIRVSDQFGIESIQYSWDGEEAKEYDLSAMPDNKDMTITLKDKVLRTEGETGTKKLTLTITDRGGNTVNKDFDCAYSFVKPESKCTVTAGTKSNPVKSKIEVCNPGTMTAPDGEENVQLTTLVLFKADDGKFYMYQTKPEDSQDVPKNILYTEDCISQWGMLNGVGLQEGTNDYRFNNYSKFDADDYEMSAIRNKLAAYGERKVTVITLPTRDIDESDYHSFTLANATVEEYSLYQAIGSSYECEFNEILDSDGETVIDSLDYDKFNPEAVPAASLDGVTFNISLNNLQKEVFDYGLKDINFDECKIRLKKCTQNSPHTGNAPVDTDTLVCETNLVDSEKQSFTISAEAITLTGWYYVEVCVKTIDGSTFYFYKNDIFADLYSFEDFMISSYNKVYETNISTLSEQEVTTIPTASNINPEKTEAIVGIAAAPENFVVKENKLVFSTTCDAARVESINGLMTENLQFKAWSKNDENGASSAVWSKFESATNSVVEYQLLATEEFSPELYQDGVLPVTAGDNVVCYQVKSTNGQIISKEILVHAMGKAPEFDLSVVTGVDKQNKSCATIKPVMSAETALFSPQFRTHAFYSQNNQFGAESDYDPEKVNIESITVYQSGEREFYLFDSNANLEAKSVKITDVDGLAPTFEFVNDRDEDGETDEMSESSEGGTFYFKVRLADNEDVKYVASNLYLTFDETYSKLLTRGTSVAAIGGILNADGTLKIQIPVNLSEEDDYVWESYNTGNYGIYRTHMNYIPEKNAVEIDIWGTIKYDNQKEKGAAELRKFTLESYDSAGNECGGSREYSYNNVEPQIEAPWGAVTDKKDNEYHLNAFDDSSSFGVDANLQLGLNVPISRSTSYGAGKTLAGFYSHWWYGDFLYYRMTFPMIKTDGDYEIDFMDLFGSTYTQDVCTYVNDIPTFQNRTNELNLECYYSEQNLTNQDVSVVVNLKVEEEPATSPDTPPTPVPTSSSELPFKPDEIATIAALSVNEDGGYVTEFLGEIDEDDPTKAKITLKENGFIQVEAEYEGRVKNTLISVTNIDKEIETVEPYFIYNGKETPEKKVTNEDTGEIDENTVIGPVKVGLSCQENLEGIDGPLYHTFAVGSKKGATHTFNYKDAVGNTGSTTVELPYNVEAAVVSKEAGWEDKQSPSADIDVYALRSDYRQLTTFADEDSEGNTSIVTKVCEMADTYQARAYKLLLDIDDESLVKAIVKEKNADAPTSYADTVSDNIKGVKINGSILEVAENAEFDLYLIDEKNNITAFKGFDFNSVYNKVIEATVEYKTLKDKNGIAFVRAYLNPADPTETLIPINSDISHALEKTGEKDLGGGKKEDIYSVRYYHDFTENDTYKGKYEFKYKDSFGNSGKVQAEVKGIDYTALILNSQQWFGTVLTDGSINIKPNSQSMKDVSHDVTSVLRYNKSISQVKLYKYDALTENHTGEELIGDSRVHVDYIGYKATVTYSANFDEMLVLCTQAENGKTVYTELPAVQCIDKQAPKVIDSIAEKVADNHLSRNYTIKTDEPAYFENSSIPSDSYKYTALKNGKTTISFKDEAGNTAEYEIDVAGIDDKKFSLLYGDNASPSDMTSNLEELNLKEGDTLYVKASKAATITVGNGESYSIAANETVQIPLNTKSGIYVLKAVDNNTGKALYANIALSFMDKEAPVINFLSNSVVCPEGTASDVIMAELKKGVVIEDNADGVIGIENIEISGIPNDSTGGIYNIVYKATDSSGNKTESNRVLYLYNKNTPSILINGEKTIPFGLKAVSSPTLQVNVQNTGFGPITLKYKEGIKTSAQMKYNAEISQQSGMEQQLTLPNRSGFYTIYIRTQNRTELLTYVYVDVSE